MSEPESRPAHSEPLKPSLDAVDAGLRRLSPAPAALDRDRLMYRAGRTSVPSGWMWPAATGISSLAALVLGVLLLTRPEPAPRITERIVYLPSPEKAVAPAPSVIPEPAPILASPEPMGDLPHYRQIQERILRWDLEGVPASQPEKQAPHEKYKMLMQSY